MFDFYFHLPLIVRLVLQAIAVILFMFPVAAACSMAERKVCAWIQNRPGPNRAIAPIGGLLTPLGLVGRIPFLGAFLQQMGVFQLAADGGKFTFKEDPIPGHVNKFYFVLAPIVAMIPALTTVVVVPVGAYFAVINGQTVLQPIVLANVDIGILAVFAVSSLGVYAVILAGWASNSKYAFLGGVRASAQLVSYELAMTLSVLPVFLWMNKPGGQGTLSLFDAVQMQNGVWHGLFNMATYHGMWGVFYMPISAFIFLVALFAETNRAPFDMAEAESELVAGFHTEYGAFKWSLFFLAEYCHMIVGSAVCILLFFGGWNILPWIPLTTLIDWLSHIIPCATHPLFMGLVGIGIFVGKVFSFIFFFMWVRWTLPRFRYDQIMHLGWKKLLPLSIANLLFYTLGIALLQK